MTGDWFFSARSGECKNETADCKFFLQRTFKPTSRASPSDARGAGGAGPGGAGVDQRPERSLRVAGVGALLAMLAGLLVWLGPIGVGGRMPVGGDVTQFSLGLMAVLARAIRGGRLPTWNDLWGYGFPGLAESQMGVYYPPHLVLYGLLPLATAYTASLVLH